MRTPLTELKLIKGRKSMYKPKFNHVLVEINDKDAKWGKSSDGNIGGDVYREGKVVELGVFFETAEQPLPAEEVVGMLDELEGKQIMWNEGHEAGTVHEFEGKKYALIYWFDIIGVKA